jgi:hypothetical protein
LAPNPGRDWMRATTPFRDYAAAWLEPCEVKPRTREGYAHALTHVVAHFGDQPIGEISVRDAREFMTP